MKREIEEIADNILMGQSDVFSTNIGIIVNENKCILIDPGVLPCDLDEIEKTVNRGDYTIDAIIITHSHWDHLLGVERFPGVEVIAHENYLNATKGKYKSFIIDQIDAWEKKHGIVRNNTFLLPEPGTTFNNSLRLQLGNLSFKLIYTPGHSEDQLVIYIPKRNFLWAGDMLSDVEIPYIMNSLYSYKNTLERIASFKVDKLVPGHGNPAITEEEIKNRIEMDLEYLMNLEDKVKECLSVGKSIDESVDICENINFRNHDENKFCHVLNVESAYIEMGGDVDPDKYGWMKLPFEI